MPNFYRRLLKIIPYTATNMLILFIFANLVIAQTKNVSFPKKLTNGELVYQAEKLLSEKGYWITKVDTLFPAETHGCR